MLLRIYTVNQKYVKNKHGDIGVYKKKIKKWIKSNKPYKAQKRGLKKERIYSKKFGFLDLYSRIEMQDLICPSGYTIGQCFNVLRKVWYGYHKARRDEKDYEGMVKYAKAIQNVQEDMGIATTSFPHLGMYGDVFILNNNKGERVVFENHSVEKQKQKEYEKWYAERVKNATEIQKKLQRPDKKKGETILTIADDVAPHQMIEAEIDEIVPQMLEPEEDEEILTIADDLPFQKKLQRPDKKKGETILTIADDVAPILT
jgi:hypothetical protein